MRNLFDDHVDIRRRHSFARIRATFSGTSIARTGWTCPTAPPYLFSRVTMVDELTVSATSISGSITVSLPPAIDAEVRGSGRSKTVRIENRADSAGGWGDPDLRHDYGGIEFSIPPGVRIKMTARHVSTARWTSPSGNNVTLATASAKDRWP